MRSRTAEKRGEATGDFLSPHIKYSGRLRKMAPIKVGRSAGLRLRHARGWPIWLAFVAFPAINVIRPNGPERWLSGR
jgi:hypothetical protein